MQPPAFLNPRHHSLARGNTLVWGSLLLAVLLSRFPNTRPTALQLIPTAIALCGTSETLRCIRKRWSFYHAGVLLCLYMDLMAISIILFFLIYPYFHFIAAAA
jgi:hypothetical protein